MYIAIFHLFSVITVWSVELCCLAPWNVFPLFFRYNNLTKCQNNYFGRWSQYIIDILIHNLVYGRERYLSLGKLNWERVTGHILCEKHCANKGDKIYMRWKLHWTKSV